MLSKFQKLSMKVQYIRMLEDNFAYVLYDEVTRKAAVVDPVEPEKVLEVIDKLNLDLNMILTTHHHWDHASGNNKILSLLKKSIPVYGGDENIQSLSKKLCHGDEIKLATMTIKALHTPCHTKGHICYFVEQKGNAPMCFTGDTLFIGKKFVAGCGRFFEGDASQMNNSLNIILKKLPMSTLIYPGHEYTLSNLKVSLLS
ncbi:hydroxyacylglutathione hydrolase [Rozella allomycis CSF55]|uniref:hydroxyacylglutathione hydrolase n=1 Tax=Rozella allomycis (strain CSF55) TaxID=988480 RepID=A0A4P9YH26_ROZAC|nr:hydroxyacylglutathione hydrolase [Rozella allomycis CSF55]